MKKTLLFVCFFVLFLVCFSFSASAAEQMNFTRATGDLSGENWYWHHAEKTLEVRSFTLRVEGDDAIVLPENSRFFYSGDCSITSLGGSAISSSGLLVVNGTGNLSLAGAVYGVRCNETVLFSENVNVEGRVAAASGLIEPDGGRGMTVSNGGEFIDEPYDSHKYVRTGLLYPVYVTVTRGGGATFYSGMFAPGQTVVITARPKYGYGLVKWHSIFVELENPEEETVRFVMPSKAVRVNGEFGDVYSVSIPEVEGGKVTLENVGTHFAPGEELKLIATTEPGYYFSHWEADYGRFADDLQPDTSFIMPSVDVVLYPVFEKGEAFTMNVEILTIPDNSQAPGGRTNITAANFAQNKMVLLRAIPADGYVFSGWMSSAGRFTSSADSRTYFTMPDENVTITAVFSLAEEYKKTLTVSPLVGGTVNVTGGLFVPGTAITLRADARTGYRFVGWTIEPAKYREFLLDGEGAETRFLMPDDDVTISARFALMDPEAVTFYLSVDQTPGGTITTTGAGEYLPGYEIDLSATPDPGYYFAGWQSALGGKFENSSDPNTIFYMPANNTRITAVFAKVIDTTQTAPPADLGGNPLSGELLPDTVRQEYVSFGISLALCSVLAAGGTVYADVARKAEGLAAPRRRHHRRTLKNPRAKRKP